MAVVFTDNFTVGSDTPLESYGDYAAGVGGNALTVYASTDRVECEPASYSTDVAYVSTSTAAPTGDQEVSADCGISGSSYLGGYIGVRGDATSGGNGYVWIPADSVTYEYWRVDNGVFTMLAQRSGGFPSGTRATKLKAEGAGATVTLTGTVDGTPYATYGDSSGSRKTSGKFILGFFANSTSHFVDNISVDNLSAAATTETEGYRYYQDDAAPGSATPLAAQDTSISIATSTKFRLRVLTDTTGDVASVTRTLQYRKTGDTLWDTVS